jgi:hypothetical protein
VIEIRVNQGLDVVWNHLGTSEVPYSANQQLVRNPFLQFLTANRL